MPLSTRSPRARRRWRVLVALCCAAGVALSGVTIASAHSGAAVYTANEESDNTTQEQPPATLTVAPLSAVAALTATEVEFTVRIDNPGTEELAGGVLELFMGTRPLSSATSLGKEQENTGATTTVAGPSIAAVEVSATRPTSQQEFTITVPRDDLPEVMLSSAGVYAVSARLGAEQLALSSPEPQPEAEPNPEPDPAALFADTSLVWHGVGTATFSLGLIVPLVLPSEIQTMPSRSKLGEIAPQLKLVLTAAEDAGATLAIDPRIIASIRAYGTAAPAAAQELLQQLEESQTPSFLLQFADADPAAQATLGFTELLQPESLAFITRNGTFTSPEPEPAAEPEPDTHPAADADPDTSPDSARNTAPNAAADQVAPEAPEAPETPAESHTTEATDPTPDTDVAEVFDPPTLEELLSWPQGDQWAWPAPGSADRATLTLLENSGVTSVVLDSDNVSLKGGPRATLEDGTAAIVTDATLTHDATVIMGNGPEAERAAARAHLVSDLALRAASGSPGAVLALDRGALAASSDPAQLITDLSSLSWVTPTPLYELADGTAALAAGGTAEARAELLRAATKREESVVALRSLLAEPEYLDGYQRSRLLSLFATRYAAPTADFEGVASSFRERDAELLQGVRAVSTEHTQLVGATTRVPLQLRNWLPFDAVVRVQVRPVSAALSVPERLFTDISLPANGNATQLVTVHTRISSGESGLVIDITDNAGDFTSFTGTLDLSIRSVVETIALWSLGVIAAVFLVFGVIRSIRNKRKPQGDHTEENLEENPEEPAKTP